SRVAAVVLVALAALGPLALVDPEEVSLVLLPGDVPVWAAVATAASVGIALLVSVAAALAGLVVHAHTGDPADPAPVDGADDPVATAGKQARGRRAVALVVVAVLAVTTAWGYLQVGNPGFHGERLFVILRSQADLGAIAGDPTARRTAVYRRLVAHAERTQASLRRDLDELGVDSTPYYLVNAIEVDDNPLVRVWLAGRHEVDRVLDSPRLRPLPAEPTAERGPLANAPASPTPGLVAIGAPKVWATGTTGRGVVVGVSDSGMDGDHAALRSAFRGGVDSWYDPWNGTRSPVDPQGHGTHTTATAVGSQNVGVAPGAEWIGCVNLARNWGNPAYYLDCLQFMLAPFGPGADPFTGGDPSRAADVLNNSWGCTPQEGCDAGSLRQATRALRAAGIFVVASAGNTGPRCSSVSDPPAVDDEAFSVGATDAKGQVASFSSRGPVTADDSGRTKPDLVAPGVDVVSALPGGTYGPLDGTSMAGPHVAGVVALVWEAAPTLRGDVDATEQLLRSTASTATASHASRQDADQCGGDQNIIGAGLVNASAAVDAARDIG
ncbi:MAG TPA: S8 family serine peptidase, partial [Cryptosporangiaceae bacterium]|nr:S8 family serine peptidase [Cryptosporangiaceae bacterium]